MQVEVRIVRVQSQAEKRDVADEVNEDTSVLMARQFRRIDLEELDEPGERERCRSRRETVACGAMVSHFGEFDREDGNGVFVPTEEHGEEHAYLSDEHCDVARGLWLIKLGVRHHENERNTIGF